MKDEKETFDQLVHEQMHKDKIELDHHVSDIIKHLQEEKEKLHKHEREI